MSKADKFEYNLLAFIFQGIPISSLASTIGTTGLWIGLHTADPTDAGSTANEGGYAAYTRIKVDRSTGGWTVSSAAGAGGAFASPVANIDFPQVATTSTGTFTHMSVNMSSASTGPDALYTGTITPNINFSQNVTPRLTTGTTITED